ncbi:MAG: hypothetical protein WDM94_11825 [Bauldia sp.]
MLLAGLTLGSAVAFRFHLAPAVAVAVVLGCRLELRERWVPAIAGRLAPIASSRHALLQRRQPHRRLRRQATGPLRAGARTRDRQRSAVERAPAVVSEADREPRLGAMIGRA